MKTLYVCSIAMIALIIPAACQTSITTSFRGDGFTVTFPKNWKQEVSGPTLRLTTVGTSPAMFTIQGVNEPSKKSFFNHYREFANAQVGFPVQLSSSTEPMLYGKWRGDALSGDRKVSGSDFVVSATAIEANSKFYLLQIVTPLKYSYQGYVLLESLGSSLVFDRLPAYKGSSPEPSNRTFKRSE